MSVVDIHHSALYKVDVESMLIGDRPDIFFEENHLRFAFFRCIDLQKYYCQACAQQILLPWLECQYPAGSAPVTDDEIKEWIGEIFFACAECIDVSGENVHELLLGFIECSLCKRLPIVSAGNSQDCDSEHIIEASMPYDCEAGSLLAFLPTYLGNEAALYEVLYDVIIEWKLTRTHLIEP